VWTKTPRTESVLLGWYNELGMFQFEIALNPTDIQNAFHVRREVFVVEQKVPEEMERDEFDKKAIHVIAKDGNQVVGTGRLIIEGNNGHIGRLAVEKRYRHKDIGTGMMMKFEEEARKRNLSELYLHAQASAQKFYDVLGYVPRGEKFDEVGIEHVEMYKILSSQNPTG
jgi:predicted GNAT family N-acyltransferase